jgi:hypothetical protein
MTQDRMTQDRSVDMRRHVHRHAWTRGRIAHGT